jgi:hypothetical protein
MKRSTEAFTLAELLVSITVVVILVLVVSRVVATAANVASRANKRMDTDEQARELFGRMAIDFAHMIKRPDVDCYIKGLDAESGNDTIAFFCDVPGYYPSTTSQSPISLVSYRITGSKMERMSKGLLWNGASATDTPLLFGPSPTLQNTWATAVNGNPDPDYEVIGPQVFRFEYFYILKDGTLASDPGPNGLQQIAAVSVCIAVVDAQSRALLANALSSLAAPTQMKDFAATMSHNELIGVWQSALDKATGVPRSALPGVRLYQRDFYLK